MLATVVQLTSAFYNVATAYMHTRQAIIRVIQHSEVWYSNNTLKRKDNSAIKQIHFKCSLTIRVHLCEGMIGNCELEYE